MLTSYRKSAGALALAMSVFAASGALAETRNVLIVDGAYFPSQSHVQPGDQVIGEIALGHIRVRAAQIMRRVGMQEPVQRQMKARVIARKPGQGA